MKRNQVSFFLILLCASQIFAQSKLRTKAGQLLPPKLAVEATLKDESGDQILETDESGTIVVNLMNRGGIANSIAGSDGRFGWTAGYGVEFAMTSKWTARAETSYYGFGRRNITLSDGTAVNSDYGILSTKIGVNYKLN